MRATDNEDGIARAVGTIDEGVPASWGPQAPDGGPTPEAVNLLAPAKVPDFTAKNSPCLRNCRFFMRVWSHFDVGNVGEVFPDGHTPRVQHLQCNAQPGVFLELTADSPVLECNHWDPMDGGELHGLARRREHYFSEYPDNRPGDPNEDYDLPDDDQEDTAQ